MAKESKKKLHIKGHENDDVSKREKTYVEKKENHDGKQPSSMLERYTVKGADAYDGEDLFSLPQSGKTTDSPEPAKNKDRTQQASGVYQSGLTGRQNTSAYISAERAGGRMEEYVSGQETTPPPVQNQTPYYAASQQIQPAGPVKNTETEPDFVLPKSRSATAKADAEFLRGRGINVAALPAEDLKTASMTGRLNGVELSGQEVAAMRSVYQNMETERLHGGGKNPAGSDGFRSSGQHASSENIRSVGHGRSAAFSYHADGRYPMQDAAGHRSGHTSLAGPAAQKTVTVSGNNAYIRQPGEKSVIRTEKRGFRKVAINTAESKARPGYERKLEELREKTVKTGAISQKGSETAEKSLRERKRLNTKNNGAKINTRETLTKGSAKSDFHGKPVKFQTKNAARKELGNPIVKKSAYDYTKVQKEGLLAKARERFAGKGVDAGAAGKNAITSTFSGGGGFGSLLKNKGLAVIAAGALSAGATSLMSGTAGNMLAWTPLAAHYYTNGLPQCSMDEYEQKKTIMSRVYDFFAEKEDADVAGNPVVITQAAVNKMSEYTLSFEGSVTDWEDNSLWDVLNLKLKNYPVNDITDRGVRWAVPEGSTLADIDGKGTYFTDYTSEYTYVGYPENGNGMDGSGADESRPEFTKVPENKRGSVEVTVVYSDGVGGGRRVNRKYYPYAEHVQYMGETEFGRTGYRIAGWALKESPGTIMFTTYEQLDSEAMHRMLVLSENGQKTLEFVAVWVPSGAAYKTLPIQTVKTHEIEKELSQWFTKSDLSVCYRYMDSNGETKDLEEGEADALIYNRDELYKAILSMATVATDNDYKHPDAYKAYCEKLLQENVTGYSGCSLVYRTKSMVGSAGGKHGMKWLGDDGHYYIADGARLCVSVTIYVNPSMESMISRDDTDRAWWTLHGYPSNPFPKDGWTEERKEMAKSYMDLSADEFMELFQAVFPPQGAYMDGEDSYAELFNYLISKGFAPSAAIGILANLAVESGGNGKEDLNATKVSADNKRYGIAQISRERLEKGSGMTWPNIPLTDQMDVILTEMENGEYWKYPADKEDAVIKSFLEHYDIDYCTASASDYKNINDRERATAIFACMYIRKSYPTSSMDIRMTIAEELSLRVVYGEAGGSMIERAVEWALNTAADNSHGYSLSRRSGPIDYDCSSFVSTALMKAGFDLHALFRTANETEVLLALGFTKIPTSEIESYEQMQRGDIIWRSARGGQMGHTGIYIGDGNMVHAIDDYDGVPGDLTDDGKDEIAVTGCAFRNYEAVFRAPAYARVGRGGPSGTAIDRFNTVTFYAGGTGSGGPHDSYGNPLQVGMCAIPSSFIREGLMDRGTVLLIRTQPTGEGSFANNRYFIVTDCYTLKGDMVTVDVFCPVGLGNNRATWNAPYGRFKNPEIRVVEEGCSWSRYMTVYYPRNGF